MADPKNRSLAIGLALAAAVALVYAGLTRQWLVSADSSVKLGLRSDAALIEELHSIWGDKYTSSAFAPMGWATLVECLLAAVGLAAAAGIALARTRPDLPMAPTTLALLAIMAALITGCVFVATKPGAPGFVGVGISFWIFGAGAVVGIAGAQMLAKVNRPVDPDLMEDAMNPEHF